MSRLFVNLACGDVYLDDWVNLDYSSHDSKVLKADLLSKLPFNNNSVDLLYCSHFVEHIPRDLVVKFLCECYRVIKPQGYIRLVLPDLQEMCQAYLDERNNDNHEYADFIILEILDQCVRNKPGGDLQKYYDQAFGDENLMNYIKYRTGYTINPSNTERNKVSKMFNFKAVSKKIIDIYISTILLLLPKTFRRQNVKMTSVGELHTWIYDFYTIKNNLNVAGFVNVNRVKADTTGIDGFNNYPLDTHSDGTPRKGAESMYIEATKL